MSNYGSERNGARWASNVVKPAVTGVQRQDTSPDTRNRTAQPVAMSGMSSLCTGPTGAPVSKAASGEGHGGQAMWSSQR